MALQSVSPSKLGELRKKSNLLPFVAITFWLIVNVPPWPMYGTSIVLLILSWGTVRIASTNSIFPLTYLAAFFTVFFALTRFRLNLRLSWLKSLALALTTPFAFTATFETVYQNLSFFARPAIFETNAPGELLLASWILLGFSSLFYWRPSKKFFGILAVDVAGFALWAAVGYPQIFEINQMTNLAYAFNILTKLSFALTFIILIYDGTRKRNPDEKEKRQAVIQEKRLQ
jgi:hypothetical protein